MAVAMKRLRSGDRMKLEACDLILRLLQNDLAQFDCMTGEFRFCGLRYGASDRDWLFLVQVVGEAKMRKVLADAGR